jgi:uncharacterized protein (UPF0332 family)
MHSEKTSVFNSHARFKKALGDSLAATKNYECGFYMAANDRAFFCMYHAVRGLLALDGYNTTGTTALIRVFNDIYIRKGFGGPRLIEMFEEARKSRMDGLCSDLRIENKEEAKRNVTNAEDFLEKLFELQNERLAVAAPRCSECGQLLRKRNERGAGRKRIASKEIIARVTELRGEGLSHAKIAARLFSERGIRISETTVGYILRGDYKPSDAG